MTQRTTNSPPPRLRSKYWRHGRRYTITALGAQRRVQALRAIGWTVPALAEATGLSTAYLYQLCNGLRAERINRRNAEAIDKAYRWLSVKPQHTSRKAKFARAYARKRGWYPPFAWDDIDDPKCRPTTHRRDNRKNHARTEKQLQTSAPAQDQRG